MKTLLAVVSLMGIFSFSGCGRGLESHVFYLDARDKHALVRNQGKEVLQYKFAYSYRCTSEADFDSLMYLIAYCREKHSLLQIMQESNSGLDIKIYFLDEGQGGLVRKQTHEVLPFTQAHGFLCLSPSEFDAVIQVIKGCRT